MDKDIRDCVFRAMDEAYHERRESLRYTAARQCWEWYVSAEPGIVLNRISWEQAAPYILAYLFVLNVRV